MKVLCFFQNNDGTRDHEILEFHVVEKYIDEEGKKQKRGFVFSQKHGVCQIDSALIPQASIFETLALRAVLKMPSYQQEIKGPIEIKQIKEKSDDWS